MIFRTMLLLIGMLSCISCSSWLKRQECKQMDWYQYGHSIAMEGRRLTGDSQIAQCKDAEFDLPLGQLDAGFKEGMNKYCQPSVVYSIGKQGEFFNPELCDPAQIKNLQEQHRAGLAAYCTVENGFVAGSSGKKYQNICPQKSEVGFLKEYRKGRKAFLNGKISEAREHLLGLDREIPQLEGQRFRLGAQLNAIPASYMTQKPDEDPYRSERDRLNNQLRNIDQTIDQRRREREKWVQDKGSYVAEIATLEE